MFMSELWEASISSHCRANREQIDKNCVKCSCQNFGKHPSVAAAERKGNTKPSMVSSSFTGKPGPESGPDCLTCAIQGNLPYMKTHPPRNRGIGPP